MSDLTRSVHPVADLFPMLAPEELEEMAADIRERGLLFPIVLDQEGQVLDGRNRLKACEIAGVEPVFTSYEGEDPAGYALSVNIARRHLSKGQLAMIGAKARLVSSQSTREVARQAGTSQARVFQASVVLKHAPDLADEVVAGSMSLDIAYKTAQENKSRDEASKAMMAGLRDRYVDLADKVTAGEVTPEAALGEAKRRDQEQREAERRHLEDVRMATDLLYKLVSGATLYSNPGSRQRQMALFNPQLVGPLTKAEILEAAASLRALAEEW